MLEVRNCPMLTKLPFATRNGAAALEEIRGELQWRDHLLCCNDKIRCSLLQRFQPLQRLRCSETGTINSSVSISLVNHIFIRIRGE
ncbi:hypothetical protein V6N13_131580 [Hibiscus sabdariffa]